MNLEADGCWGAEAALMLPLVPHSPAPGTGRPGAPMELYPVRVSPPAPSVSPTAMLGPCSRALSEMSLWGLSPT